MRRAIFAALLIAAACPAHAFRPFTTEDAGITEPRKLDLELGWDWSRREDSAREAQGQVSLIYGIVPRLEVGLDLPWVLVDPPGTPAVAGIGDAVLASKLQVRRESPRVPALTVKAAWKTASGAHSRGMGTGDDDLLVSGVASKNWGGHSAHAMLGRAVAGRQASETLRDSTFYGVGGDLALNDKVSVLAEVFGSGPTDTANPGSPAALRVGTIYSWSKTFWLDASLRLRLSAPAHHWGASMGLTAAFF